MEIKIGDVFKNRYILKAIVLDPENDFKYAFILYDKNKKECVNFTEEELNNILDFKENV